MGPYILFLLLVEPSGQINLVAAAFIVSITWEPIVPFSDFALREECMRNIKMHAGDIACNCRTSGIVLEGKVEGFRSTRSG